MSSPAANTRAANLVSVPGDGQDTDETLPPIPPDRINELYYGQIWNAATQENARERIHWMCAQARGRRVLDVGCSQGITSILLAREGFEVLGIDANPEAVRFAQAERERETGAVRARLSFVQVDLQDLERQSFDTVIAGEVIEHQANPRRLIERCTRFLAEDGLLVLTTPFGLHPHADHKVSLLPRDVVDAVRAVLEVESIAVVDGYIRCTASRREASRRRPADGAAMLLEMTEQGALAAQTRLHDRLQHKNEQIRAQSAAASKAQARAAELEKAKAEALSQLMLAQKDAEARAAELAAAKSARAEVQEQLDQARAAVESERARAVEEAEARRTAEARITEAGKVLAEARARVEASNELTGQMRARAEAAEVKAAELARQVAAGERTQHEIRAALAEQTAIAAEARRRAEQSDARAAALETEITRLEEALPALRTELWAARRAERAAEHKAERLAAALEEAKDEHALTARRLDEARSRAGDAEQARRDAEARAQQAEHRAAELEREQQAVQSELTEIEQEVERLARSTQELRAELDAARQAGQEAEARSREAGLEARREIERLQAEIAVLRSRASELERARDALSSRLEGTEQARREADTRAQQAEKRVVELEREQQAVQSEITEIEQEVERLARSTQELRAELDAAQKARTEAEARARQESLKAKRERDRLHRVIGDLERRLEASRQTISFRLGYALLHNTRSFAGLRALPGELRALRHEARRRRQRRDERARLQAPAQSVPATSTRTERESLAEILRFASSHGAAAARERIMAAEHPRATKARLLVELARAVRSSDPAAAVEIGRQAYELDAEGTSASWLASLMHESGLIDEPAQLLERAELKGAA